MDYQMVAPLVNAAGSAATVALSKRQQDKVNKANMELAEYQYEKNLEMWNRNNLYNTPSAQRSRMEAAGFNPNLVYGHGTVVNTSQSSPQYQVPTLQAYTGFTNIGQAALEGIIMHANVDKAKADAEKAKADAIKSTTEAAGQKIANDVASRFSMSDAQYKNSLLKFSLKLEEARSKYYDDLAFAEKENSFERVKEIKSKINEINETIKLIKAQTATEKERKGLITAQTGTEEARKGLVVAQTRTEKMKPSVMASEVSLNQARAVLATSQGRKAVADAIWQEGRNELAQSFNNAEIDEICAKATYYNNLVLKNAHDNVLTDQQALESFSRYLINNTNLKYIPHDKAIDYTTKLWNASANMIKAFN